MLYSDEELLAESSGERESLEGKQAARAGAGAGGVDSRRTMVETQMGGQGGTASGVWAGAGTAVGTTPGATSGGVTASAGTTAVGYKGTRPRRHRRSGRRRSGRSRPAWRGG